MCLVVVGLQLLVTRVLECALVYRALLLWFLIGFRRFDHPLIVTVVVEDATPCVSRLTGLLHVVLVPLLVLLVLCGHGLKQMVPLLLELSQALLWLE